LLRTYGSYGKEKFPISWRQTIEFWRMRGKLIAMPSNVFYPSLNNFCRKYLVEGSQPFSAADVQQLPIRHAAERAALFEHLLLFDTISFKIHGENIPLVLMLRFFGEHGLEALIDQGAIKFVLWIPIVTYSVTEMPGVNALQSGNFNSPAHSDPEQSIDTGLRWLGTEASETLKKRLKKKALPLYEMPSPDLAGETVSLTNSTFASGKLKPLGFDPSKQRLDNLVRDDRARLAKCASDLLEYRYLLSRQMTAMSSFPYFSLFSNSLSHIETAGKVTQDFARLSELEHMPDLQALFPTLPDGLKQIPALRDKRSSERFRQWLTTATGGDKSITEEYLTAITEAKGPLDTKSARFVKAFALASLGGVIGHLVEGTLPGAVAGGLIAQTAGPAVEGALDFLDELLLDGLRKGWHPRMFFNDLKRLQPPRHLG
jgi:hypothetical protein